MITVIYLFKVVIISDDIIRYWNLKKFSLFFFFFPATEDMRQRREPSVVAQDFLHPSHPMVLYDPFM